MEVVQEDFVFFALSVKKRAKLRSHQLYELEVERVVRDAKTPYEGTVTILTATGMPMLEGRMQVDMKTGKKRASFPALVREDHLRNLLIEGSQILYMVLLHDRSATKAPDLSSSSSSPTC